MRLAAACAILLLALALVNSYSLNASREEMLAYYYSSLESKIPKSARALVGDERINVYIEGKTIGMETRRGELYSFELSPIDNPTTEITVSDAAVEKISGKEMGIMAAINSGEIKITTHNFLSMLKMETMKRIYSISGVDEQLLGKKKAKETGYGAANSIYVQRTRIWGS